jgi:hypothetical protein
MTWAPAHSWYALVSDAHRLLGHLPEQELGAKAAEAVAPLALVAGQDVEPAEGSDGTDGRWRIARRVATERVISTVDPEARHAHKTGPGARTATRPTSWSSQTRESSPIVTDTALTLASGPDNSDAAVSIAFVGRGTRPRRGAGRLRLRQR